MKAIYNSRVLPLEKIGLENHNRAFCYGDGLFETIVTGPERINLTHYHMARLAKACALLHIEISFDAQLLEKMMEQLRIENQIGGDCRFRLQVWRSSGGLYEPLEKGCEFLLTAEATSYPFYGSIDLLGISEKAKVTHYELSFAKTMSSMPYVVAGLERRHSEFDDLIITNEQGEIAEAIVSNIFWITDDQWYTPALSTGCIQGTMREYLMDRPNNQVSMVHANTEALREADSIFLTNAAGIRWVRKFDRQTYQDPAGYIQPYFTQPQLP